MFLQIYFINWNKNVAYKVLLFMDVCKQANISISLLLTDSMLT